MTTRPSLINDRLKSTKHGHYKRSGKGLVLRVRVTRTSILRLYTLDPPLPPLLFSRVTWHGCCHPFVEFEIQQPCADSYPLPPILRQICTINGVKFNFQNFDHRSDRRDALFQDTFYSSDLHFSEQRLDSSLSRTLSLSFIIIRRGAGHPLISIRGFASRGVYRLKRLGERRGERETSPRGTRSHYKFTFNRVFGINTRPDRYYSRRL